MNIINKDFIVKNDFLNDEILISYTGTSETVTIPEGITEIGECAFEKNEKIKKVICPTTLKIINEKAFFNSNLQEIVLNEGLESIMSSAFSNCINLKNINIPNSVNDIRRYCFSYSGLQNVELPESLKKIKHGIFSYCENLKNINLKNIEYIENFCFEKSGLINVSSKKMRIINASVFENCENLESANFENLESIGRSAFANCKNLENIEIGNNCIILPENIFSNCSKLKNIKIPFKTEMIGHEAFSNSGLESVIIDNNVQLSTDSFFNCKNLETLYIGSKISEISSDSFRNCEKLKNINIDKANKYLINNNGLITNLEQNCLYMDISYDKEMKISNNIDTLKSSCFMLAKHEKIQLNENIKIIPYKAFYGNKYIKSIKLPKQLEKIDMYAFSDSSLKELKIPNTIEYLGMKSLFGTKLEKIYIDKNLQSFGGYENLQALKNTKVICNMTTKEFEEKKEEYKNLNVILNKTLDELIEENKSFLDINKELKRQSQFKEK